MGGDNYLFSVRLRLAMILGGLLAIAAIFGLSGRMVESPPSPGAPAPKAEQPSSNQSAADDARRESERRAAEAQQAERKAAEEKAAEKRAAEEKAAQAAEMRREAEERLRLTSEAARREAESQRLAAEQAEAAWRNLRISDIAGLEDYLRRFPESARAGDARAALARARQAAEKAAAEAKRDADAERDWPTAEGGGAAALRAYLQRYPNGPRAAEAQAALDGLTRGGQPAPPPAPPARIATADDDEGPIRKSPARGETREYRPRSYFPGFRGGEPAQREGRAPSGAQTGGLGGLPAPKSPPAAGAAGETSEPAAKPTPKEQTIPEATPATARAPSMPLFPKEPPRASARYEIPDAAFAGMKTYGEATKFILAALESGGYVERSYFSTEAGGVAMVTRLERINDDGTPAPAASRWALKPPADGAISETIAFLRGLFFVEKGRYRTIVFMLQDQPFTQSDKPAGEKEVRDWIPKGANLISPEAAKKAYAGAHCTALIYEFASDGSAVKLVESRLTAREHLAKSGLLTALEQQR